MASFGDNLKTLRVERNVSQSELADMIGMHASHISRYERELTQPTLDVVKRIAESLKVNVDTLVYGSSDEKAKNKIKDGDLLAMFTKVQSLDKQDISCIKNMLSAYILKTELQEKLAH